MVKQWSFSPVVDRAIFDGIELLSGGGGGGILVSDQFVGVIGGGKLDKC